MTKWAPKKKKNKEVTRGFVLQNTNKKFIFGVKMNVLPVLQPMWQRLQGFANGLKSLH